MLILDLSEKVQSFELVHGQRGYCRALARTSEMLLGGSLTKVTYSAAGFVARPTSAQTLEYFVGYVPVTIPADSLVELQIGGLTGSLTMWEGLSPGLMLSFSGDQIRTREAEIPAPAEFGSIVSVDRNATRLFLFPRLVREML